MKIVDRHLLRSLLVPLCYCMITFTMLFVIWDLFEDLSKFLDARTPPGKIALYYLALLLPTLEYLLPVSLLLATLYATWQLTRNSELMAMRASGVSLYRIMLPFLLVGILATIATSVIKETVTSRALTWTSEFKGRRFREERRRTPINLVCYNNEGRRLWFVDRYRIGSPHVMSGVKITQEREDGSRIHDLIAGKAEWLDGSWWLYNLYVQHYDGKDNPVGAPVPARPLPLLPGARSVLEMPQLNERPARFLCEAKNWEFLTTWEMIQYLQRSHNLSEATIEQKTYDIHNRLALPWACIVVTLFGIPAGAVTGRQNALRGIFTAVAFFFGYYALSQVGLFLGKTGLIVPWLGAWISNILFATTGTIMIARMR